MDKIQAVQLLKSMLLREKAWLKQTVENRSRMKESERAMTLAHYTPNCRALEFAIKELEGTNAKA